MQDLSTPVQYLKGVGPGLAARLLRLEIRTVADLLWHLPHRYIDRRQIDRTGDVAVGPERSVLARVRSCGAGVIGRQRRPVFEVLCDDGSGPVVAKWFHFREDYLRRILPVGQWVLLYGEVTQFGGVKQFIHPEIEAVDDGTDANTAARLLPVYPLTEGVSQRLVRKIVAVAWDRFAPQLTDPLPPALADHYQLIGRREALEALHFPEATTDVAALNARRSAAHRRLIFEEALLLELGLALRRAQVEQRSAARIPWDPARETALCSCFPFTLTVAQRRVWSEIATDLQSGRPMQRLVQGDVGSGKTAVAAGACVQAIAAGWQVAFMAPTEILAEQHRQTLTPWCAQLGIPLALLTAKTRTAERRQIVAQLGAGELPLLIGTHALLEDDIQFARLGLIVIDEQHRFGVMQRFVLHQKATCPHLLVLSATPIPRTLAMTYFGDLDTSVLDELPVGRTPIVTKHYTEVQRVRLYDGMRKELARGRQAYVVYPLVAESEKVDLKNATDMAAELTVAFGPTYRVALLHGRMETDEKAAVMQAFKSGDAQILATTSVVEVGVDVPNASVMVIEHAERFGLSQLHQLRGRVGRGMHQSYCILVSSNRLGDEAYARLRVLCETTDGFRIAEEDLRLRGPGEFLGTRQSGLPGFRVTRLLEDADVLREARDAAFQLIHDDPTLAANPALRTAVIAHWGERLQLGQVG
ncbi:MAG: ATP-dependent DNA helicase RecG [Deltaproteobacteria bacterium]|nr:ATP-dependent DNA helicase RecG [Deltaproteobacteria bacterium]